MMTTEEAKAYRTQEAARLNFIDGTGTEEDFHKAYEVYIQYGIERGRQIMQEQIDNGMDTSDFN